MTRFRFVCAALIAIAVGLYDAPARATDYGPMEMRMAVAFGELVGNDYDIYSIGGNHLLDWGADPHTALILIDAPRYWRFWASNQIDARRRFSDKIIAIQGRVLSVGSDADGDFIELASAADGVFDIHAYIAGDMKDTEDFAATLQRGQNANLVCTPKAADFMTAHDLADCMPKEKWEGTATSYASRLFTQILNGGPLSGPFTTIGQVRSMLIVTWAMVNYPSYSMNGGSPSAMKYVVQEALGDPNFQAYYATKAARAHLGAIPLVATASK